MSAREDARAERAAGVIAAYRSRLAAGHAEPIAELLARHAELRDLIEAMLAPADAETLVEPSPDAELTVSFPEFIGARIDEILEQTDPSRARALRELCEGYPEFQAAIRDWVKSAFPDRPDLVPPARARAGEWREVPAQIGSYKILEPIAEGGMGTVYLAEQVELLHRQVAIKLIRTGMDTREVIARFEIERQALAMMSHPNVARVYDAGRTVQGLPYFVMEYVPGVPITQFCDTHRLTTAERLDLFIDVCSGINHAHENGIIHRDIKPSNILVMRLDGVPVAKIIDFGVAKATNLRDAQKTLFTQRGLIVGTPEYMSPEQAAASDVAVDARTDVYSLGILLYELLVGELPFEPAEGRRRGLLEIRRKIREDVIPRPSTRLRQLGARADYVAHRRKTDRDSLVRQLRGPLDWIVMRATQKDPARRYPTAKSLANDIARFRQNRPVVAAPPGRLHKVRTFVLRNRPVVTAAAALLLVVAAAALAFRSLYLETSRLARDLEQATAELATERHTATERDRALADRTRELARQVAALEQLGAENRRQAEQLRQLENASPARRAGDVRAEEATAAATAPPTVSDAAARRAGPAQSELGPLVEAILRQAESDGAELQRLRTEASLRPWTGEAGGLAAIESWLRRGEELGRRRATYEAALRAVTAAGPADGKPAGTETPDLERLVDGLREFEQQELATARREAETLRAAGRQPR